MGTKHQVRHCSGQSSLQIRRSRNRPTVKRLASVLPTATRTGSPACPRSAPTPGWCPKRTNPEPLTIPAASPRPATRCCARPPGWPPNRPASSTPTRRQVQAADRRRPPPRLGRVSDRDHPADPDRDLLPPRPALPDPRPRRHTTDHGRGQTDRRRAPSGTEEEGQGQSTTERPTTRQTGSFRSR